MDSPSGRNVVLNGGGYEAVVVAVGGGIRSLRKDGYDVVAGYEFDEMCTSGRGQLLLPWPNRIEDGRYEYGDSTYQLGLSEPAKRNASHGLVRWVPWRLDDSGAAHATWVQQLPPQPGYPFALALSAAYRLDTTGLHVSLDASNRGRTPAPYGAGAHPYLTVGRRIDECELTLPAASRSEVSERGLPSEAASVTDGPFDFQEARVVGATSFDNPFGDLEYTGGTATVLLRDPATERQASLIVDESCRWIQVFSGDELPTGARESLAVEPMTCPPNAFRSGLDLVTLEPGDTHSLTFTLA